ncbi:pleckstrin homology domain-containing family J member 1-like [Anthonomus grandis grandis]|uniref:pleckstrin homology domain-containing family J member 1-like n=1 Tax=Anthonomus grandis grandis TaxID=2921223 RepID=UPI0021651CF3|nr:pleckstrin homology domain-containing family J member 1-like [Anthonomus grandis grandis]
MRFNDRELMKISEGKGDLEGVLSHMKPQGNEWSDWYQQTSFKERYFKLKANLLFYSRITEQEPLGVLVLENVHVAYERPHKGIPFAFSLTFKVSDKFRDSDAKHIFSCRCDSDVNRWVSALKMASYEYWRSQYTILSTKLAMKAGKDPILEYLKDKTSSNIHVTQEVKKKKEVKATFYSHIESSVESSSTFYESSTITSCSTREICSSTTSNVENLITF